MTEITPSLPTPVPVAFLLCDQVSVDSMSGKKTIIGVFDRIWVETFPAAHRPIWLYVRVINCEGQYPVKIEYVQVASQTVMGRAEGTAHSGDRQIYTDFVLQLPQIPLPERGEYEFRLWMDNKFISSIRLTAYPRSEMEVGS